MHRTRNAAYSQGYREFESPPLRHSANVQDRDGAGPVLKASCRTFPFIEKVFADAGYQGPRVRDVTCIAIEIVKTKPDQVGFAVQQRRWVVERFFRWISRNRRLWEDAEATIASATAFLYAAAVLILVRRLARFAWVPGRTFTAARFGVGRYPDGHWVTPRASLKSRHRHACFIGPQPHLEL